MYDPACFRFSPDRGDIIKPWREPQERREPQVYASPRRGVNPSRSASPGTNVERRTARSRPVPPQPRTGRNRKAWARAPGEARAPRLARAPGPMSIDRQDLGKRPQKNGTKWDKMGRIRQKQSHANRGSRPASGRCTDCSARGCPSAMAAPFPVAPDTRKSELMPGRERAPRSPKLFIRCTILHSIALISKNPRPSHSRFSAQAKALRRTLAASGNVSAHSTNKQRSSHPNPTRVVCHDHCLCTFDDRPERPKQQEPRASPWVSK